MKLDYFLTWFQSWRWQRLLCWVKSCWRKHICFLFGYEGGNQWATMLNDSLSNGWNCLNASGSSAFNSRKRFGYAPCCWLLKIHSLAHVFLRLDLLRLILRTTIKVLLVPSCRFAYLRPLSWTEVRNFIISAIFKFEITCARHPISLANWLIRLSPIHTFTTHGEESVCLSRPKISNMTDIYIWYISDIYC